MKGGENTPDTPHNLKVVSSNLAPATNFFLYLLLSPGSAVAVIGGITLCNKADAERLARHASSSIAAMAQHV
jgi:hypothetical protein